MNNIRDIVAAEIRFKVNRNLRERVTPQAMRHGLNTVYRKLSQPLVRRIITDTRGDLMLDVHKLIVTGV